MELNPREYSVRPLAASATSKKYLPRFVPSIGFDGLPGHASGSGTRRSSAKRSSFAFPVWEQSTRIVLGVAAHAGGPRRTNSPPCTRALIGETSAAPYGKP